MKNDNCPPCADCTYAEFTSNIVPEWSKRHGEYRSVLKLKLSCAPMNGSPENLGHFKGCVAFKSKDAPPKPVEKKDCFNCLFVYNEPVNHNEPGGKKKYSCLRFYPQKFPVTVGEWLCWMPVDRAAREEIILEYIKTHPLPHGKIVCEPKPVIHDFGWALKQIKDVKKVSRKGWCCRARYVRLISPGGGFLPFFRLTMASESVTPWCPTHQDLLAEDWFVVK